MSLFWLYKKTMTLGTPLIRHVLNKRVRLGKEDPARLSERFGKASINRPDGSLMWVHVASVGEAQSMLPMIDLFLSQNEEAHVLVTTITRTAATLLEKRLPERAFHQYLPIDRLKWVRCFLDHWTPDLVLWAESELWPVTMAELAKRRLPVALLNARMSPQSFKNWSRAKGLAEHILSAFTVILTQTEQDKTYFDQLGGRSVVVSDNIKYCAEPLPVEERLLSQTLQAIGSRPCWVYASSHKGEEELALQVHLALKSTFPDLLTIVVPRHPERSSEIDSFYQEQPISFSKYSLNPIPDLSCELYLVDTLGLLGLYYRACPITCIGRSFSDDGGGGHNPLEPALLRSAVLHGPHIQNLQEIYDQMDAAGASVLLERKDDLVTSLSRYFSSPDRLEQQRQKGYDFAMSKRHVLDKVIEELEPVFLLANLPLLTPKDAA